jgi:hypothetical protein
MNDKGRCKVCLSASPCLIQVRQVAVCHTRYSTSTTTACQPSHPSPAAAGASRLLRALSLSIALLLLLLLIQLLACNERPVPLLLLPVLNRAMLLARVGPAAADTLSAGCIACWATIRANLQRYQGDRHEVRPRSR